MNHDKLKSIFINQFSWVKKKEKENERTNFDIVKKNAFHRISRSLDVFFSVRRSIFKLIVSLLVSRFIDHD